METRKEKAQRKYFQDQVTNGITALFVIGVVIILLWPAHRGVDEIMLVPIAFIGFLGLFVLGIVVCALFHFDIVQFLLVDKPQRARNRTRDEL